TGRVRRRTERCGTAPCLGAIAGQGLPRRGDAGADHGSGASRPFRHSAAAEIAPPVAEDPVGTPTPRGGGAADDGPAGRTDRSSGEGTSGPARCRAADRGTRE